MSNLRWFAAFHNESYHPHVHMIVYSTDPTEGYLSEKGLMALRSSFAKDIFAQDLLCEYKKQTEHRDTLKAQSREVLAELIAKINGGIYDNSQVETLLQTLAKRLAVTNGKKQYGYLRKDIKEIVNSIVDDLGKDERIAALYDFRRRSPVCEAVVLHGVSHTTCCLSYCGERGCKTFLGECQTHRRSRARYICRKVVQQHIAVASMVISACRLQI